MGTLGPEYILFGYMYPLGKGFVTVRVPEWVLIRLKVSIWSKARDAKILQ